MKYKLVNKDIRSNYGAELLKERGVKDLATYLNPPSSCLQDPRGLDNIEGRRHSFYVMS